MGKMASATGRIIRILLKSAGWFMFLLIVLLLLLRLPAVQTGMARIAADKLSRKTDTRISLDRVNINFIDRVTLKGLYIEDQAGDTMLYAGLLRVNLEVGRLLNRSLEIDRIELEKVTAHLAENDSGTFNFQFLVDSFQPKQQKEKKQPARPFAVSVEQLSLHDLYATAELRRGSNRASLKNLDVRMNLLDLAENRFDVRRIEIDRLKGRSTWQPVERGQKPERERKPLAGFPLRNLPVTVLCDKLAITGSDVHYQIAGALPEPERFDARYLDGRDLNLEIRDIRLDSNGVEASVRDIRLDLNGVAHLKEFRADAVFAADRSSVSGLELAFNDSRAGLSASTAYAAFNELAGLGRDLGVSLEMPGSEVDPADVLYFLPAIADVAEIQPFLGARLYVRANVEGRLDQALVEAVEIRSGQHHALLAGTFSGLPDWKRARVAGGSLNVQTPAVTLQPFLGGLAVDLERFGRLRLDTRFAGGLNDLEINRLELDTDALLRAGLSGSLKSVTDPSRMTFDMRLNEVRTGYADLAALLDSVPPLLQPLDTVRYSGTVAGNLRDFHAVGSLNTSLGRLGADLELALNPNYSNATYKGYVDLFDVQAGELLGIDSLGTVSLTTSIDGSGLSLDSLNASMNTYVQRVDYRGYLYEHFALDGTFERRRFDGDFIMRDENISVDFSGHVDLNDSLPDVGFTLLVDQLDLYRLNLTPDPFSVHGRIAADFTGIRPDDAQGSVVVSGIELQRGESAWQADTVMVTASIDENGFREMHLQSPVAEGKVQGRYSIAHLGGMLSGFANPYFDVTSLFSDSTQMSLKRQQERYAGEDLELSLAITDPVPLAGLFNIGLTRLDTAHLYFLLDNARDQLELSLEMPGLEYGAIVVDSLVVQGDNTGGGLNLELRTGRIAPAMGVSVPGLELRAEAASQEAALSLIIPNDTGLHRLELHTRFRSEPGRVLLFADEPFVLNAKPWDVLTEAPAVFYRGRQEFPVLTIQSGQEAIRMEGGENILGVDLLNFDMNNLTQLVDFGDLDLGGILFGDLEVGLSPEVPLITGDLDIRAISANGITIGDLELWAGARGNKAWGTVNFTGFRNEAVVEATYDLQSRQLDGEVILERLQVASIQPFVEKYARDASGFLSGNIRLQGTVDQPVINGDLEFFDVAAFAVPAQTRYAIGSGNVLVSSSLIKPDLVLLDESRREAYLRGKITHDNFRDMGFDVRFNTDGFTFLNSSDRGEDLYYGKFVARLNAVFTGTPRLPRIRASLTTLDESDLTVQLLSRKAVLQQEAYVIFYDGKNNYSDKQLDSLAVARYRLSTSVDLTLNAAIRENALVRLVIDPVTGDNLEVRGNADLVVRIPENGDLTITGTYMVEEGSYRFSYQSLLKRDFAIDPGSRILFTGNLMDAQLDLTARYDTEASTYSLLAAEAATMSDSEARALRRKSDVSVLLNIGGKLSAPELSFDIRMAGGEQGPIGSSVDRALASLRQNESELNKQVFSLLLFNSFTGISSTGSASTAGTGTAMRSVGNLINTQLNRLAQKAQGLEIDFDLDQYAGAMNESGAGITEIDLGISQSLFQDKLVISVSSNIGLEGGNPEGRALSNVAGDFVLEYKITQGGKYRVKVFQTADYDALTEDNVWKTGVGFSYQTRFGRQFFKQQRHDENNE